jgi:hypothetical protein
LECFLQVHHAAAAHHAEEDAADQAVAAGAVSAVEVRPMALLDYNYFQGESSQQPASRQRVLVDRNLTQMFHFQGEGEAAAAGSAVVGAVAGFVAGAAAADVTAGARRKAGAARDVWHGPGAAPLGRRGCNKLSMEAVCACGCMAAVVAEDMDWFVWFDDKGLWRLCGSHAAVQGTCSAILPL